MARLFRLYEKKRGDRRTGSKKLGSLGEALFFVAFLCVGCGALATMLSTLIIPEWRANRQYVEASCTVLAKQVGNIDLIYEAVGVGKISFDVLKILGLNGVFVFTGIPPHKPAIPIEADSLMRQVVLMNQAIIGTVNADRPAFENAIRDLAIFKQRWPDATRKVITGRHPMESYRELLLGKAVGIKNVITIGK